MRFRCRVTNVSQLTRVIQSLEKLNKVATLLLTPERMSFVIQGEVVVWASIAVKSICDTYTIESLNQNEIGLELDLSHVSRALKSAQSADAEMRLKKIDEHPYLGFTVTSHGAQAVTVVQDVPITVLSGSQVQNFREPQTDMPDVQIFLPPLKQLYMIVERLAHLGDRMLVVANMAGELTLKVQTDMVSVATFYKNLKTPVNTTQETPATASVSAEATVDVKQFAKILYSYMVNPNDVLCCILRNTVLLDVRQQDDLYLTYYIPTITV
eukprot:TRINITY_DN2668_c0_g1_i2.p2 TRINITY_DN2668_c0_g1~~TRINITY_DN2668_c0_g1_i2.p2  ORF type:complete len:268 (-),score=44.80 TRINITY_DN2668_c0_g1_i2:966-1769(-)